MALTLEQQKAVAMASARARAASASGPTDEGGIGSFIRNAANGATFNLADTIAAAGDATIPLDKGASSAPTWMQRFQENRASQRQQTSADQSAHPVASVAGGLAGGFVNPATRALPVARTALGAVGQGAGVGASYGAGGGISNQDDLSSIAGDAASGGFMGGLLGGAFHGAGKLIAGATRNPDAVLLNQNNIPTTIGQDLGGGFKRAEDAGTSMPWGGDAIIARQKEGLGGFNRALENNAANAVGLRVPTATAPGNEAGRYLNTMNDAAYKAAYTGATIQKTPQLVSDLQAATDHFPSGLNSKPVQQDFNDRILKAFDASGNMSSQAFNDAKDWLASHSDAGQNATPDQRDIASAYGNAKAALLKELSAQDPQRGAMLKAADTMYARRMPLIDAAGNTNASARDGIVTPAQYSRALDSADGSAHGVNFSLGNLPMQDMVKAAQRTLPSSVPDSGTAIRRLLTGGIPALAGAAVGGAGIGIPGLAAAGLPMLATRLLYSKKGQDIAKAALFGAPQTRAQLAKLPKAALPGLLGLFGSSAPQTTP